MNPIVLQIRQFQFPQQDPTGVIIGAAVVGGIIGLLVVLNLISSAGKSSRSGRGTGSGNGLFARFAFRSKARSYGLGKPQILVLEHIAASHHIAHPDHLLENQTLLDNVMRKAVHAVDISNSIPEEEKDGRKAVLFQIRQIVDIENERRNTITSSVQLKINQDIEVITPDNSRLSSQISKNQKNYLGIDIPTTSGGYEVRPPKGTELKVFFSRNGRDLYSFTTHVIGYQQSRGVLSVILQHSADIRQEQKRQFRRKEISSPAYFYPIQVVETGTGKNRTKQAMVDTRRRLLGTILDISAGGCAMKSPVPLAKGQLIKIEFNRGKEKTLTMLGKVLHVRQEQGRGSTMHIKFTRVSQKNVNIIQEYVYGISED